MTISAVGFLNGTSAAMGPGLADLHVSNYAVGRSLFAKPHSDLRPASFQLQGKSTASRECNPVPIVKHYRLVLTTIG